MVMADRPSLSTQLGRGQYSTLISDIKAAGADYQATKFMSTPWTPPNNSVSKWKVSDSYKTITTTRRKWAAPLRPAHYATMPTSCGLRVGIQSKMGLDLTVLSLQKTNRISSARMNRLTGRPPIHTFLDLRRIHQKGVFNPVARLENHGARIQR